MTNQRLAITEHELRRLTAELDELHHDLRPGFLAAVNDLGDHLADAAATVGRRAHTTASRRTFLVGAGALGGAAVLAACGSSSSSSGGASASPSSSGGAAADLTVARLAASLEVLAVGTYKTALTAAGQGAFGTVPPAFGVFAQTAMAQHQDHQNAWNSALAKAGQSEQTTPDPKYKAVVDQAVPTLKDIPSVAKLALTLETVAFETYTKGAGLVSDKANRAVALSIAPVEAQHAAVLQYLLGQYPVPDSFIKTDMAASPSDLGS